MSSWVQLLLALLAACARCGVVEGDALPAALEELVRNSPVASIEDLQLLLFSDAVDEEEDGNTAASEGHRLPRSLDAQPAQQALCKVRTEVVEVTRAMLDRSNANFLLWPPCVEVQRCSGCCNTKSLQCIPIVTHTRYLQVMKIEYINKRPTYAKAVVSVVDHVECRCQPAPQLPVLKKKSSRRHMYRNQTLGQASAQVKMHSKDVLHQLDELKQTQRAHLEDLLEQHWNPRGDTFPQPEEGYSLVGEETSQPEEILFFGPHWTQNSTQIHGTEGQTQEVVGRGDGEDSVGVKGKEGNGNFTDGNTQNKDSQTHSPLRQEDRSKISKSHISGFSKHVTESPQAVIHQREETLVEKVTSSFRPTKEPNPDPREPEKRRENETPEVDRMLQLEEEKLEAETKELLLLHKRLDQEKEILRQQKLKQEEEERLKEKETNSQHHLHGKHHHHHHHHLQTTTQKPETSTTTTRKIPAPTGPRTPARPNPTRRKPRKNRRRISKAAMRAMLM